MMEEINARGAGDVHPAEEPVPLGVGSCGECVHIEATKVLEDLAHGVEVEANIIRMEITGSSVSILD